MFFLNPLGNIPWLGMGLWCNGCPPAACEDDEAIIHGYCCGCAYGLGNKIVYTFVDIFILYVNISLLHDSYGFDLHSQQW